MLHPPHAQIIVQFLRSPQSPMSGKLEVSDQGATGNPVALVPVPGPVLDANRSMAARAADSFALGVPSASVVLGPPRIWPWSMTLLSSLVRPFGARRSSLA